MAAKIRSNDQVIVIAGKDKGKTGTVTQVLTSEDKVVVEGINVVKKAVRPNPQTGEQGGLQDKEMPLHVSNVAILNPATGKADRVGFRVEDEKKVRFFKSNNELI
ncbi:50S ribosomal protein L24 [Catenovulum sediminis]|uniref:Large ribosomal subunit protein uL24 n=1 Tax=Catenovulum sediminis TaxID=1740262 RepID=A0ABV1REY4_9ALTE|nr:50S ribosomal protein L24 [Catenovulum sediminis]